MKGYWLLGPQGRFDVADTVPRGVANEVAGPIRTAVPPPEPIIRSIAESLDQVGLHLLVPGHYVRRAPIAPAPVDQGVDLVALQTTDFRRPFLTAEGSGAVRLPVNDVRQGILNGPGILRLRPRDAAAPVRGCQPLDDLVELPEFSLRPLDHVLARMRHCASAGLSNRRGQHVDSLIELGILDQNRWQKPDHRPPGGQDEDAALLHGLDHGRDRLFQLDSPHKATAADLADLWEPEVTNPLLEADPPLGGAGMQGLGREHPKRHCSRGTDQRIAGEGAAMAAFGDTLVHRLRRDGHAEW